MLTLNQRAAKEDRSVAFKVLQTVTMLVDSRSVELTSEVLGPCLSGCLVLGAAESEYREREGDTDGVGRAAAATMNQVVGILFERSRDVILPGDSSASSDDSSAEHDESLILDLARRTLTDLCTIVQDSYDRKRKRTMCGPFAKTVKEKMAPSPRTCLSLIDTIFKQRGMDFFRVCQRHFKDENDCQESETLDQNLKFAIQSIYQASELVISILQWQHLMYYSSTKSSESSNPSDFCFYYYATSLATTILTNYLTPHSLQFYQRFDEMNPDSSDDTVTQIMSRNALTIIQLLVNFVSGATEVYHKSEFEDGYIFNQTEREALNIGKDANTDESTDDHGTNPKTIPTGSAQATPDSLVSNDQLWRAFLSLEVIYSLMCTRMEQLFLLDSCVSRNEPVRATTIGTITKAASDLATISDSNRERILHVVLIAHGDASVIGEPSGAATSLAEKFSDSQSARLGDVPICDIGLATWLSFKCILALARSLKRDVVLSEESESIASRQVNARRILNEVFAPSVSILQHYIKRMSGSHVVVSLTLSAYKDLAYTSMVLDSKEDNLRRHTILTSLCKLCLPSWGKNRANS